jgi:Flp pilus assembly protein TadG
MLAIGAVLFMGILALVIDLIFVYYVHSVLVTTVDAAVLRATRSIGRGASDAEQQAEIERVVALLFAANFPEGHLGAKNIAPGTPTLSPGQRPGTRVVAYSASVDVPTIFYRWFGGGDITISASSTALRKDVNMMLVLDRSGSMFRATGTNPGPNAIADLKFAAELFVNKFDNSRDRLGLVTYGTTSNLDYAPSTNFKTDVIAHIRNIFADNSGTNSPDALWRGYNAISGLADTNALNVIVFFTDGASTNFSAIVTPSSGGCDGTEMTGGLQGFSNTTSTAARGLWQLSVGPPPVAVTDENYLSGCGFGTRDLSFFVPTLPLNESHGASITGPRAIPAYTGSFPTTRGDVIRVAAANATINVAGMARGDATTPVTIFSIGLGGNSAPPGIPLDVDLLNRVSNTVASPSHDPTQPIGKTFITPGAGGLQDAFDQVASEVLRLIE